jgi:hypothetical protein
MPVLKDAMDLYGLQTVGRPAGVGFACYLITLERSLRHPSVVAMASQAREIMKQTHVRGGGKTLSPPADGAKPAAKR